MKKQFYSIVLTALLSTVAIGAQQTPPARPGFLWIAPANVVQGGKQVFVEGHWERARATKENAIKQKSPDGTGFYLQKVTYAGGPGTPDPNNQKRTAISENNTTGSSDKKVVRGGGSQQKSGGVPKGTTVKLCYVQEMRSHKIADQCGLVTTRMEIYPGNIISGKNFINGAYTTVSRAMNPVKLFIPNVIFQDETKAIKTIESPTISSLSTAIPTMINTTFAGKVQADMQVQVSEVFTSSDVQMDLNVHADGFFGVDVTNKLSVSKTRSTMNLMVSFLQKYFTVGVELPSPDSLFKDRSVPDNDMMYIKSVTYGRRGFLLITVDTSGSTIKDSLKANGGDGIHNVSINADYFKSNQFKKSQITGYIFGGSAAKGAEVLSSSDPMKVVADFFKFISTGAEFSTADYGRPIEYEVAYVRTGEQASIEYNIQETRKICEEGSKLLRITFTSIKAEKVDDGDNTEAELYGIIGAYYSTLDKPVSIPDSRFRQKPFFDTENGNAKDKQISLPTGGKAPINNLHKNILWSATRSERKSLKQGSSLNDVSKSLEFLFDPANNAFSEIILFANLDEADPETDDRMEGGNQEKISIKVSDIHGKKAVKQLIRDTSSDGTKLWINYTIEIVDQVQ